MAKPRSELSAILHSICEHVYFQPPVSKKLTYPCIIYKLDNLNTRFADNGVYKLADEYSLTYVTRDPNDPNFHAIAMLRYCTMTNTQSSDNLHHYYYRIYF